MLSQGRIILYDLLYDLNNISADLNEENNVIRLHLRRTERVLSEREARYFEVSALNRVKAISDICYPGMCEWRFGRVARNLNCCTVILQP